MKKIHSFLVILGIFFVHNNVLSLPILKFNRLETDQNISLFSVRSIQEDNNGTIWILTNNNIFNFDGYALKSFPFEHRSSVSGTLTFELYNDTSAIIGTAKGFLLVDLETRQSKLYNQVSHPKLSSSIIYTTLAHDKDKIVIGTIFGVDVLDLKSNRIINLINYTTNNKSTADYRTNKIIRDSDKKHVWVGSHDGLFKLNLTKQNAPTLSIRSFEGRNLKVFDILKLKKNHLIIASNLGLLTYNIDKQKLELFSSKFRIEKIRTIINDDKNNLWVGSEKNGLFLIDKQQNVRNFKYERENRYSLPENYVSTIFQNSTGSIFIGTYKNGVTWFDPLSIKLSYLNHNQEELSCLQNSDISSISKYNKDDVVISNHNSVAIVNISQNRCDLIHNNLSASATFYFKDKVNTEWIGTAAGMLRKHQNENSFKTAKNFPDSVYFDYLIEENGDTYFSLIEGVYLLRKGEVKPISLYYNNKKPLLGYSIVRYANKLIVGTFNGLIEIKDNDVRKLNILPANLENTAIRKLYVDSSYYLWVVTHRNGIFRLNHKFEIINTFEDESSVHALRGAYDFIESVDNAYYLSSENGISKIDTNTNKILNFHTKDGLQGEEFATKTLLVDEQGYVYAGGKNGLNYFSDKQNFLNEIPPKIVWKEFFFFNSLIDVNEKYGNSILEKRMTYIDSFRLNHNENSFGFEFSGIHFSDPKRNEFAFLLDGYDKKWNYTSHKYRRANYTGLPPGDYTFKVKAANSHGIWSEPKELKITILPPFWLTPTAYVIYAILIILSVYSIVMLRTRTLTKRAEVLESSIKQRTQELATEKNKVEQLLSKKNDEFTNVSHEFRTPLTLIIGPLRTFIQEYQDRIDTTKLSVIERNSQRLLRMVNQMLNMETLKVNAITKRIPENFTRTTELGVKAFTPISKDKGIDISLEQKVDICFSFTPDAYEKILLNLLSNAVKYTNEGGKIKVTTTRTDSDELVLTVKDTGIGIAENKQATIFERFNRVIDENSERVTGAGIGLALVKELVEAHDGRIELKSELGQGTTIRVYLPIINEVAASTVEQHENKELVAMELMALADNQLIEGDQEQTAIEIQENRPSVLVIEDNADMRHYIESNINSHYQVLIAKNGEEGVKLAESEVPDLIISDIMMPKMNGYEVTRALRQSQTTSHIPIILLTAKSDLESRIKGWQENADEYLTKPFNIDELLVRLKNLLDIRDLLKKRFANIAFALTDKTTAEKQPVNQEEDQEAFIIRLNDVLNEIYADSNTRVKDIAINIAMSERQLHRKLKGLVDLSPNEYLRRYRLEKGKELLAQGKSPNYAAFEVGFSSQSYFGRCFKAQYGVAPSDYAK